MDPNTRFQRAGQAFQQGRLDAARADLRALLVQLPNAAQAWHMLALAERRLGNAEAARDAFAKALRFGPNDPAAVSNYGNFLGSQGDHAEALRQYRGAVTLKPDFADAWLNLGLTAIETGDIEQAATALNQAIRLAPRNPKCYVALGLLLRDRGERDAAAEVLDQALILDPAYPRAVTARAMVEQERGGPHAVALLSRARALSPEDRDLALAEAAARAADGDPEPDQVLLAPLAADAGWTEGHAAVARLRHERGRPDAFATLDAALRDRPADTTLWTLRLNLAAHAQPQAVPALAAAARAAAGTDRAFDLIEADALLADDPDGAARLVAEAPGPAAALLRARIALRRRDPAAADAAIAPLLANEPRNQLAWALAATAWRLGGDPRADWLLGVEGLWRRHDLGLDASVLGAVTEHVRGLHTARHAPLDQSLRDGTQTGGTLFLRTAPEVTQLRRAIEAAVNDHIAGLPSPVTGHPLLDRPRQNWRFTGSWSVRLTDGGRHVAHVHPEGWISSACYLALPELRGEEGWLELGAPPADLRLDLPPLGTVEPLPGTLALFPSFLWHGTRPFAAGERLSVAFDVVPADQ